MRPLSSPALALLLTSGLAFAESPKPLLSEDFENVPVGQIPPGFTKAGSVAVAGDAAHSGKQSLRLDPAVKGPRTISKQGPGLTALGGAFWGRLYFKVKLPAPAPVIPEGKTSGIIHTTLVSGKATSPLFHDPIDVRLLGTVLNGSGAFSYLYNVQPKRDSGRKEFGTHSKNTFHYTDGWTLAEWHIDHATQSYHLYIDGEEIKEVAVDQGAGQFAGAEIPAVFDTLTFGWNNYQPASGEGYTVWIDDLALAKERLGPAPTK